MRWRWVLVGSILLATACAGGRDSERSSGLSSESVSGSSGSGTTDEVSAPTAEEQLWKLRSSGAPEIQVDLAELSAYVGELPGAPHIEYDESLYPSFTGPLIGLTANRDQLSDEQRLAFDEARERLFLPETIAGAFDGDGRVMAAGGDGTDVTTAGRTCPDGIPGSRGVDSTPTLDRWRDLFADVSRRMAAEFPGSLDYSVSLADPLIWDPQESGAGTYVVDPAFGIDDFGDKLADCFGTHDCHIMVAKTDAVDGFAIGIAAHELFHCWHFSKVGGLLPYKASPMWVTEGLAAWVGEDFGGGTSYGTTFWSRYFDGSQPGRTDRGADDGTYDLFFASYSAIGFWSHVAGHTDLSARIPAILGEAGGGESASIYAVATEGMGSAAATVAAAPVQRGDLGPEWTTTGPGMPAGNREAIVEPVRVGGSSRFQAPPGVQDSRAFRFDIDISSEYVVTASLTHRGVMAWDGESTVVDRETIDQVRCLGEECACPDGTGSGSGLETIIPETNLTVALSGGPFDTSTFQIDVQSLDDWCVEPRIAAGGNDDLVGVWRADNASLTAMFSQVYAADGSPGSVPLEVAAATGEVLLTLDETGTGSLSYRNVDVVFDGDSLVTNVTVSGRGSFVWTVDNGRLVFTSNDFALMARTPALGNIPLILTEADTGGGGATDFAFGIVGRELTLFDPVGSRDGGERMFFPTTWFKQ